jgi:hypothetical protein
MNINAQQAILMHTYIKTIQLYLKFIANVSLLYIATSSEL